MQEGQLGPNFPAKTSILTAAGDWLGPSIGIHISGFLQWSWAVQLRLSCTDGTKQRKDVMIDWRVSISAMACSGSRRNKSTESSLLAIVMVESRSGAMTCFFPAESLRGSSGGDYVDSWGWLVGWLID